MIGQEDWTPQERWVWERVTQGQIADFHESGAGYGGPLDPKQPGDWPESRVLRPGFLETVLLHQPWRGQIPHQGLRIARAWFRERLDLSNAELSCALWLDRSRFDSAVDLSRLNTLHSLSLNGSALADRLAMDGLKVGGGLFMRDQARFAAVRLRRAHIEGQLNMNGSTFTGELAMDGLKVGGGLFMRDQARFAAVRLHGARVTGNVDMDRSAFTGELAMDGLRVGGQLFMRHQARFAAVRLHGAHIEGQLDMSGSTFTGVLAMDGLKVGGGLFMSNQAEFAAVGLLGAHIEGQLSMNGSTFTGEVAMHGATVGAELGMVGATFDGALAMDGLKVGGGLFMGSEKYQPAAFTSVRLLGARVEGQLVMARSTFRGAVNMDGLEVGGELFADATVFGKESGPVAMPLVHVGRLLSLNKTDFSSLDLTGARIDGTFRIAVAEAAREGRLELTGATIGAIEDSRDGWPLHLRLDGFTYTHWDALNSGEGSPMAARPAAWFTGWLGRQTDYSPRPYEQLAKVLRETGHAGKAKDVLFEARERERREEQKNRTWWRNGRWWWLTFKWAFIGHGYRLYWSLWWALLFVVVGAFVIDSKSAGANLSDWESFAYSLDMLLPVIELNKAYNDIVLSGPPLFYFYCHKIMGFVLASFLVAGLSGLAK
jgi:hypothetical protein